MAKKGTEVAVKETNALAIPDELLDFAEQDAGSGFEEADQSSYAIPFLRLLQKGSPQCDEDSPSYDENARPGMILNTASGELFDGGEGVQVVPCYYKRVFIEWKPRETGGGIVAEHSPSDPIVGTTRRDPKNGRDLLPNGNYLEDTRNHYVLVLVGDEWYPAVVSMSATQLKKSRKWMTVMNTLKAKRKSDGALFTPPMFSHVYTLSSVGESNDKGSWKGWDVELARPVADANLYQAAKAFRDSVSQGEAKVQKTSEDIEY